MTPPRGPTRWLHLLGVGRPRPAQSVEWEIEHHIAELADRLVADGWDEGEARREAERRFGSPARYGASMRRMERRRMAMVRRTRMWDFLSDGVRRFVRTSRRYPAFTAGVVLTLALGIGANVTMYGIVDRLLLQPPEHIVEPDQVRRVFLSRPSSLTGEVGTSSSITYLDYADLKAATGMSVAAYGWEGDRTVGRGEAASRAKVELASAELFPLLGVQPVIGRFYTPEEAAVGSPLTAVISEEYWRRAYASDPGVLGRSIEVSGSTYTIVGVTPAGFTGMGLETVDVWLPLEAGYVAESGEGCLDSRGCWWLSAVVRLADGVGDEAAEAEATQLHRNGRAEQIEQGRYAPEAALVLAPLIAAAGPDASDESRVAKWLTGVSLIVLLIACANVANMLLARSTSRHREVAVRLALGVHRGRLVGQVVLETVMLALVGGGVAIVLARWGGELVRSTLLPGVSFPDAAVNGRVVGYAMLASLLAGLLAGIGPALQGSRADVAGSLVDGSRGASGVRSRLRSFLTVSQAAMSVVLLVGAGLFVRSLDSLRDLDLGLDVDRLMMARIELVSSELDDETRSGLFEAAVRQVGALPMVEAATGIGVPFMWGYASSLSVPGLDSIPNLPGGGPYFFPVDGDYFRTVGLEITLGRPIAASDGRDDQKVVVVSETMARTLWPGASALGQCLMVGRDADECTTVIGVAEDAARGGYMDEAYMAYYLPLVQMQPEPWTPQALYVRTSGDPDAAVAPVAEALRSLSPEVRYATVTTMRDMLDPQARSWTLGASMFSVFGGLALLLAAIGLYSVLAFDIAQRTRELGIRTALGARKARLLKSVLVQGTRLALVGVLGGLAVAYGAAPYAADLLYGVSPRDPSVLAGVATVLLLVGAVASAVPALRATRIDPVVALRSE